MMLELPRYCYSCGAYLMGGATEHKPDCEILALIREASTPGLQPYIVCPKCGMVSHNPNDVRERYCGNCHDFHENLMRT